MKRRWRNRNGQLLNDRFAIVAVPRLSARLVAGRDAAATSLEIWADTRIELPRRLSTAAMRNLLDGTTLRSDSSSDRPSVSAAACASFTDESVFGLFGFTR